MNKFVNAIVMVLALLASLLVIGLILNVAKVIIDALVPILIIIGIGFLFIIILSILYPYIVMTIRVIGLVAKILYIIAAVGGSIYLVWKLLMYLIETILPILNISWFNNNGMDNIIDIAIIFFPLASLLADYVMTPLIVFLLSPLSDKGRDNISREKSE